MRCWFTNRSGPREKAEKSVAITQSAKKPRATNAVDLFWHDHATELSLVVGKKMQEEGLTAAGANLEVHRKLKKAMFEALPDSEKEKWEVQAIEHNKAVKQPLLSEYIDKYVSHHFWIHSLT